MMNLDFPKDLKSPNLDEGVNEKVSRVATPHPTFIVFVDLLIYHVLCCYSFMCYVPYFSIVLFALIYIACMVKGLINKIHCQINLDNTNEGQPKG